MPCYEEIEPSLLVTAIYVAGLSIFSMGRIPRLFVNLVKRSLSKQGSGKKS